MHRSALQKLCFIMFCFAACVPAATAGNSSPEALIHAGHWKQVRAIAEKLAQQKPNDAYTFYLLAEEKQAFGDDNGALPLAEKAVALDGNNAAYHLCLAEIYGDMAEHAGIFKQISLGRSFKKEAEQAVALDPKNLDAKFDLLQFYLDAPGIIGGGKDKAYAEADEIAHISAVKGFMAEAQIAAHEKDTAKAQSFYEKAVQADPDDAEASASLASIYASDSQRRYDDATRLALQAIKSAPDRIGAYTVLATMYATEQKWKELDDDLAESSKNDPDDAGAFYQAGRMILTRGTDLSRAERYFREYLNQDPEAGEPPLAAAHWRLGEVLEKENRKADAVGEMQTALKLQPNFPEAKKDLKRLQ